MHRTDKLKGKVWRFVRALFTEPDMLRADLDAMIKEERRSYQRLTVKGLVANLELDAALAKLEETREVAERELASLQSRRKRVEQMERERDILLKYYARMAPEALDELSPEERTRSTGCSNCGRPLRWARRSRSAGLSWKEQSFVPWKCNTGCYRDEEARRGVVGERHPTGGRGLYRRLGA